MTDAVSHSPYLPDQNGIPDWSCPPHRQTTMGIFVVAWERPVFLRRTLSSLERQSHELDCLGFVVDNGSSDDTCGIIRSNRWLTGYRLLAQNRGIKGALEEILPADLLPHFRYVLISDADMEYRRELIAAVELLDHNQRFGAVSYQHSPEHDVTGRFSFSGQKWFTKQSERGCALVVRGELLQAVRPLPQERPNEFDWWLIRDAPQSLQAIGRRIAVLPGGAHHFGWRQGDSTWQQIETPEFDEYKE